jgi:GNAT superfamily N-acetyltransferase
MIRLLTDTLPWIPEDDPFGCKILTAARAYGIGSPLASFWMQNGGTVIAAVGGDAVLLEGRRTDSAELCGFLRSLGPREICCSAEEAEKLALPVSVRGEIMLLRGTKASAGESAREAVSPGPREIWALLKQAESETFPVPEFEPFYLDLSHRIRHGAAIACGLFREGRLAACAVCTSVTEGAAVIAAAVCAPEFRRQGLGSAAVRALAERLGGRKIYIFRAEGENEAFYRSLGFLPYGGFCTLRPGAS